MSARRSGQRPRDDGTPRPTPPASPRAPRARRSPISFGVVLLVAAAAILSATWLARESLAGLFARTEVTSGSQGLLTGIDDEAELEVLRYIGRTVFPHDYLIEGVALGTLLRTISAAGTTAEEALTLSQLRHFRAANLAATVGLSTTREGADYVVITTSVRWGYRLGELAPVVEEQWTALVAATADDGADEPSDTAARRLSLPAPVILERRTEDINRAGYPYGDIGLNADGLRRVSEFVAADALATAPLTQLEEEAAVAARGLLRTLLGARERSLEIEILAPEASDS